MRPSNNTQGLTSYLGFFRQGFGLPLVLAMVAIFFSMVGTVIYIADRSNDALKLANSPASISIKNKSNTQAIINVLRAYMLTNGRMPCPADPSLATGMEQCTYSSSSCTTVLKKGRILIGNLPYQTLGLSKDFSLDSWGKPLRYFVYDSMTESGIKIIKSNGTVTIDAATDTTLTGDNQLIKVSNFSSLQTVDSFNVVAAVLSKYSSNNTLMTSDRKATQVKDNFLISSTGSNHNLWLNQTTNSLDCNSDIGGGAGSVGSSYSTPSGTLVSKNSMDGLGLVAISPISLSSTANNIAFVENVVFIDDKSSKDNSKINNCPAITTGDNASGYALWPITPADSIAISSSCQSGYVPHSGYTTTSGATLYRKCTSNGIWEDNSILNLIKSNSTLINSTIKACYLPCLGSVGSPVTNGRTRVISNSLFIGETLTLTDDGASNSRIKCQLLMPGETGVSATAPLPSTATCNPSSPTTNPNINGTWTIVDNCKVTGCSAGYHISAPYNICCPDGQESLTNTSCGAPSRKSCGAILLAGESTGSGVYTIDPDGTGTGAGSFQVYCDMDVSHGGGGWTLVAAQYEDYPVSNWNQGITESTFVAPTAAMLNNCGNSTASTNGCNLANSVGFALNASQIPTDTAQTAFGKGSDATFIGYSNYVYSTGEITNVPTNCSAPNNQGITNIKTGILFQIYRKASAYCGWSDVESAIYVNPDWNGALTYDAVGGVANSWSFSPNGPVSDWRGTTMGGSLVYTTSESYAWTVWVRPAGISAVTYKKSCYEILAAGESTGSGVYTIDPDGTGTGAGSFQVYCDMDVSHGGGGWTLVAAQYEDYPVSNWNQGITESTFVAPTAAMLNNCGNSTASTNGCNLANSVGFALNASQIPTDTAQTAFGKGSDATFIGYSTLTYTTGNISYNNTLTNLKDTNTYCIYRDTGGYLGGAVCGGFGSSSIWNNMFSYNRMGGYQSWNFAPNQTTVTQRGHSMLGDLTGSNDAFAWTVWVRPTPTVSYKKSCYEILAAAPGSSSGTYTIDPDGAGTAAGQFQVYCDMDITHGGGGWTLVAAQYEDSFLTNWNQGITESTFTAPTAAMLDNCGNSTSSTNGCNLTNSAGFTLNTNQLPTDRTQTSFGKGSDATFVGYGSFSYTTGDIAITNMTNLKYSNTLQIYRRAGYGCNNHDPEAGCDVAFTSIYAGLNGGLIVDRTGGGYYTYLFYPSATLSREKGSGMNPTSGGAVSIGGSNEIYAWTVWVK